MSRTKTALAAPEYAILGLLRREPAHGYRIAQRFAPGQDLGLLCPMDQSNVYALLKGLQEQGLIAGHKETGGGRPPRTIFSVSKAGEKSLDAWIDGPVEPLHRLRLDFLLKLFLVGPKGTAAANHLVGRQLASCEAYALQLETELQSCGFDSLERLVAESKRASLLGLIDWLRAERGHLQTVSPAKEPAGKDRMLAGKTLSTA